MFQVICTNNAEHHDDRVIKIPIGEVVTVVAEKRDPLHGDLHYRIEQYQYAVNGMKAWYWEGNFSKLDGPCENEILEQRMEALDAECTALFEGIPEPSEAHIAMMWKDMERRMDEQENSLI